MTAIAVSVATLVMTLLGGAFALRFKDRRHLIMGFSAGAMLGAAFLDLIPEAIGLGAKTMSAAAVLAIVVAGFLAYMLLDRSVGAPMAGPVAPKQLWQRGGLGAAGLSVHSFLDGFAIGLAFKVSGTVGMVVSIAVLVHDFSDGINTVSIVLGKQGGDRSARRWLVVDALAPVLGAAAATILSLSAATLAVLLALCAGFFVYMSASDLLPESYHDHPTTWTTVMTVMGVLVLLIVSRMAVP